MDIWGRDDGEPVLLRKKGAEICINATSRCDLSYDCEGGIDEVDCQEEYVRRGVLTPRQTFICAHPNMGFSLNWMTVSSTVPKRGVWCDGVKDCEIGEDEKDCLSGDMSILFDLCCEITV